jgi:DDE superfamily endonuclease
MIASKMCASTNDNTAYIVTKLSKDIKHGLLPKTYHVVLDEAYPCTEQEMSPWKGRNLSQEKDAFNYFMSLNRQVIERAFGILVQRWGIFWRPLRLSMSHRGVVIRVACKLHNICIDDSGCTKIFHVNSQSIPEFERETDHQNHDDINGNVFFTDGTPIRRQGYRSDLESCHHRDQWTKIIKENGLMRPTFSRYTNKTIRR